MDVNQHVRYIQQNLYFSTNMVGERGILSGENQSRRIKRESHLRIPMMAIPQRLKMSMNMMENWPTRPVRHFCQSTKPPRKVYDRLVVDNAT
jgi:hypothetical protein